MNVLIYELHDSTRILPLAETPQLALVMSSVGEGNTPNRIWVDSLDTPKSAFVWDTTHCLYFLGDSNEPFQGELEKTLANEIIPAAARKRIYIFKIHYTLQWEETLPEIFTSFKKRKRQLYAFTAPSIEVKSPPEGFELQKINKELLESSIKSKLDLVEEIESCWKSVADFLDKGWGFCITHEGKIVCRCTAEYVSRGKCGIGIETGEEYKQLGCATGAASALVEYCLSRGVTPHWDSWENNIPSIRTAQKVGFVKISDFFVHFGSVNLVE
ncbi:MAG: GNAT family N-acetyltransferase [Theionarchaea archaeon]|nr:GNAT family N-acetyltransferase [Theionarchaea archaeon]